MTKLRIVKYLQCFQHAKGILKSRGLFAFSGPKKKCLGSWRSRMRKQVCLWWVVLGFFSSRCCTKHWRKGWVGLQHRLLTSRSVYAVFPYGWFKTLQYTLDFRNLDGFLLLEDCFQVLMLVHKCRFYSVFRMTPAPQTQCRWYTLLLFYFSDTFKTAFK